MILQCQSSLPVLGWPRSESSALEHFHQQCYWAHIRWLVGLVACVLERFNLILVFGDAVRRGPIVLCHWNRRCHGKGTAKICKDWQSAMETSSWASAKCIRFPAEGDPLGRCWFCQCSAVDSTKAGLIMGFASTFGARQRWSSLAKVDWVDWYPLVN